MQEPIDVKKGNRAGEVKFMVKTRVPDPRVAGDYVREIYANMQALVDVECATSAPGKIPGELFSLPNMGSVILLACQTNDCSALMAVEPVLRDEDLNSWIERVADYITTCSDAGLGLEIDTIWTCSSNAITYGMLPLTSGRGAGRMGFASTKPLPAGISINTLKNYVLKPGTKPKTLGMIARFYRYISNWTSSTWAQAEERFLESSHLRETLEKLFDSSGGKVPVNLSADSLAVLTDVSGTVTKTVILPFPSVQLKINNFNLVDVRNAWVRDTMRDVWFQMVANVENARGITDYRPSSNLLVGLGYFTVGAAVGGYTFTYPDWISKTLGGMTSRLFTTAPSPQQSLPFGTTPPLAISALPKKKPPWIQLGPFSNPWTKTPKKLLFWR
jgi:hypothetical protein